MQAWQSGPGLLDVGEPSAQLNVRAVKPTGRPPDGIWATRNSFGRLSPALAPVNSDALNRIDRHDRPVSALRQEMHRLKTSAPRLRSTMRTCVNLKAPVLLLVILASLTFTERAHAESAACLSLFGKKDGPYSESVNEFTGVKTIESRCIPIEENGWGAIRFYHFSKPRRLVMNIEVQADGGFDRDRNIYFLIDGKRVSKRGSLQVEVINHSTQKFRLVADIEVSVNFIRQLSRATSVKIQLGGVAATAKAEFAVAAADFLSAFSKMPGK